MSEETGRRETNPSAKTLKKRIVSFDESNPAEEPLFVNYVQVAQAAGSAYIDVGVVPLDDMLPPAQDATFFVLTRLVMSRETIAALGQQINDLLSHDDKNKKS